MAKTLDELVQEQLGGLVMMLCRKDAQLGLLTEENEKLKKQLEEKINGIDPK